MDEEEMEQHFRESIAVCIEMIDEATGDLYNDIAHVEEYLKLINRCTSQLREIQNSRAVTQNTLHRQELIQK